MQNVPFFALIIKNGIIPLDLFLTWGYQTVETFCFSATFTVLFTLISSSLSWFHRKRKNLYLFKTYYPCLRQSDLSPIWISNGRRKISRYWCGTLQHVADKIPLKLEIIQTYSWKESLEKAQKNECDIVNFIPQTLEFNKWLLFQTLFFPIIMSF